MDAPSTKVNSATCRLNMAMTGIQVAKPKTLKAVDLARLGCPLPRRRAQSELRAIVYVFALFIDQVRIVI
jgi:hypothetical protein